MGRERERKRADPDTKTFGVSNVLHLWKCSCRPFPSELNRLSSHLYIVTKGDQSCSLYWKTTHNLDGRHGRKVGKESGALACDCSDAYFLPPCSLSLRRGLRGPHLGMEWSPFLASTCSVAEAEGGESDERKNAPRAIQEKADIMSWRLCSLNRVNGNLMSYILTRVRTRISPRRYDESYGDFTFPLSHFQFQALFICVIHRHIFT